MADKKVFVSYDYANDRHYRYLLSAWDANESFDFTFEDHSTVAINSEDAGHIKAAIAAKMNNAECLLVIVGKETAECDWVVWEIEKAKELGLGADRRQARRPVREPDAVDRRWRELGDELHRSVDPLRRGKVRLTGRRRCPPDSGSSRASSTRTSTTHG